ncbi:MAG TPA: hypothetical protein PL187_18045 [Caldilinea sp.]|nr:hypothetical protein [Anaerolineales bacterium]HRA67937.1 hypothetical protein [Caldilinea sp.]
MKRRLKYRCWSCDREYSMTREIVGNPQIIVACPYCGKEGAVDLDPFRDNTVSIYQSADAPAAPSIPTYTFPDVIPTSQPTDQDS